MKTPWEIAEFVDDLSQLDMVVLREIVDTRSGGCALCGEDGIGAEMRVDELRSTRDELETEVEDLRAQVTALKETIARLKQERAAL